MAYGMTAYCGLECGECPAYVATQKDDREALAAVAAEWSKEFGIEVPLESVPCDGCKSDSDRLCGYCSMCEVRSCASGRSVVTCAHCEDYGCGILLANPAYNGPGKENLERIRAGL